MKTHKEKLVIVGSGPAGWTAAIYAARADLQPLVFAGRAAGKDLLPGGQLMLTTEVENFPGFPEGIEGPEMMGRFFRQALRFGTRVVTEEGVKDQSDLDANHGLYQTFQNVQSIDLSFRPYKIVGDNGFTVYAETVVIATGAKANWLGLENELRLAQSGGGVSACAVCDGALPIFRDQEVGVVGGGDSAIEEASYLAKFASKVHIFVRKDRFRASKAMQSRVLGNSKYEIHWNTEVVDVLGDSAVTGVTLRRNDLDDGDPGQIEHLPLRGLFIAIGHTPNTGFLGGQLASDEQGYLQLPNPGFTATETEGVYAAGDVADPYYRQAITAAGMGAKAAIEAERFLAEVA